MATSKFRITYVIPVVLLENSSLVFISSLNNSNAGSVLCYTLEIKTLHYFQNFKRGSRKSNDFYEYLMKQVIFTYTGMRI